MENYEFCTLLTFDQNDLTTVLSTEYVHVNVLYSCLLKSIEIYT